jgi:hypothetical protein
MKRASAHSGAVVAIGLFLAGASCSGKGEPLEREAAAGDAGATSIFAINTGGSIGGGWIGSGGTAGGMGVTGGAGGLGGSSSHNCPASQPQDGAPCDTADYPDPCQYADAVCRCTPTGWVCESPADCPSTMPDDGADCPERGLQCTYDGVTCECTRDGWSCDASNPAQCPAAQPNDGDSCDTEDLVCDYDGTSCTCTSRRGGNLRWRC